MLWGDAGCRCAFPDCPEKLIMAATETDEESLIGEICHIVAQKESGPRGKSDLTREQRDQYNNLILLCPIHHKLIDDQPGEYTVEKLQRFKKRHKEWVDSRLNLFDPNFRHDEFNIWAAQDTSIQRYLEKFQRTPRIQNVFVSNQFIPLHEIYVEVGVSESDTEYEESLKYLKRESHLLMALKHRFHERQKRKISLDYLLNEPHYPLKVILGDPGSGKSTLMTFLAFNIAEKKFTNYEIPFLIPLREYVSICNGKPVPFLEYVVEKELQIRDKNIQNKIMDKLLILGKNKKVVFLLDGFDEISTLGNGSSWIKKAISSLSISFTVILTSRRAGFQGGIDTFKTFELIDLSDSAIKTLVRNWFRYVIAKEPPFVEQFINWILSQPTMVHLAQNPFLLSLLCYLNQGRDENDFLQVQNRTELYHEAIEVLKRDYKAIYSKEFGRNSISLLSRFALYLFTPVSGPKQLFLRDDYHDFCEKIDSSMPTALDDYWLRAKLINQWDGKETYNFVHLTFQEWSAAYRISQISIEEAAPIVQYFIYNPYWKEVFRFYAGFCALEVPRSSGRCRFEALIKPILENPDLFELHFFWLAPLLTEFQRGSGTQFLSFDLRKKLLQIVKTIPLNEEPYLKIMVDLDPEFFLEQSLVAINVHLLKEKIPPIDIP